MNNPLNMFSQAEVTNKILVKIYILKKKKKRCENVGSGTAEVEVAFLSDFQPIRGLT